MDGVRFAIELTETVFVGVAITGSCKLGRFDMTAKFNFDSGVKATPDIAALP